MPNQPKDAGSIQTLTGQLAPPPVGCGLGSSPQGWMPLAGASEPPRSRSSAAQAFLLPTTSSPGWPGYECWILLPRSSPHKRGTPRIPTHHCSHLMGCLRDF